MANRKSDRIKLKNKKTENVYKVIRRVREYRYEKFVFKLCDGAMLLLVVYICQKLDFLCFLEMFMCEECMLHHGCSLITERNFLSKYSE